MEALTPSRDMPCDIHAIRRHGSFGNATTTIGFFTTRIFFMETQTHCILLNRFIEQQTQPVKYIGAVDAYMSAFYGRRMMIIVP